MSKQKILELENIRLRDELNKTQEKASIGFKLFYLVIGFWIITKIFW